MCVCTNKSFYAHRLHIIEVLKTFYINGTAGLYIRLGSLFFLFIARSTQQWFCCIFICTVFSASYVCLVLVHFAFSLPCSLNFSWPYNPAILDEAVPKPTLSSSISTIYLQFSVVSLQPFSFHASVSSQSCY